MSYQNAGERLEKLFTVMSEDLNDKVSTCELRKFAIDRQVQRMRKRARIEREDLHTSAISGFINTNSLVGSVVVNLAEPIEANARYFLTVILERITSRYDELNIQQSLDLRLLYDSWRFGPGASYGIKGSHVAEKIGQKMTCTVLGKPLVSRLRRSNVYLTQFDLQNGDDGMVEVRGSRLTTVPKNESTRRTIAIEPSGNMCLQLAAGRYLEDALRYIGLDIRDQQPKNKLLALRGSKDGSIATIDLKSASDMISIDLVQRLMPKPWFDLLMSLRSPEVEINGEWHTQNMISTMGNGFTFPLMTIIICALLYGYRCTRGGPTLYLDWSSTAVFGDDIIIPVDEYDDFCEVLCGAGLVVNHDKSFSSGDFRESCGGDYYKGYDVTPFYVKRLDSDSDIFVAINQIFEWSSRHNCLLYRSLLFLRSLLRCEVFLVPEWFGPETGVRTSLVERRFKHLEIVKSSRPYEGPFAMMLSCGGYLTSQKLRHVFSPRLFKTKVRVKRSRLPRGYLDGSDPLSRTAQQSSYVAVHCDFLFKQLKITSR